MRRWLAGLGALACLVTACSTTVNGSGRISAGAPGSPTSSAPGFSASPQTPGGTGIAPAPTTGPTGSGSTGSGSPSGEPPSAPEVITCPTISYPYASLKFDCITTGLTIGATPDPVWPLDLSKAVEPTWSLSEGAGHWGPAQGQSLGSIATNVRTQMLQENPPAYGTSPTVRTTSSKAATVGGAAAWVLQTTFTLNPAFRQARKLTVKAEKSWIVALKVGADDVSLWYVTIPDDVSPLWAKVPAIMDTIKVI
jgi:hypothetical protein